MGRLFEREVRDLAGGWVLAPERYDPRRISAVAQTRPLSSVVRVECENVTSASLQGSRCLVLDTTHAYEGFVLFKHGLVEPELMGSTKRLLEPGDVVISRLRPYLRQVAFVDDRLFTMAAGGNSVVASTEFYVLRKQKGFDVAAIVPFLLTEAVQTVLAASQEGGHHPRFNREVLADLQVPKSLIDCNEEIGARVREHVRVVRAAMFSASDLVHHVSAPRA